MGVAIMGNNIHWPGRLLLVEAMRSMRGKKKRGRPVGDKLSSVRVGFKRGSVNVVRQTGQSNQTYHTAGECP